MDALSTLVDSEGEMGKILEGSGRLGSPGRAWTIEQRTDVSVQKVLHGGLRAHPLVITLVAGEGCSVDSGPRKNSLLFFTK